MTDINIKTQQQIEFDLIKEMWMQYALTQYAKDEIRNIEPYLSERELLAKQRETTEARIMLEKYGNPPLVSLTGIHELLEVAKKGDCLSAAQLEEVGKALVAVRRLKAYLEKCKVLDLSLPYFAENLDALGELEEEISSQIRSSEICDNATKLLKSLRADIDRTEGKMRDRADTVLRANKDCMSDSFSTMRNGHICLPVKKDCKFKIPGIVMDKSSTGNTIFIEPSSVARYYEELQNLRFDEEAEERRILYTLTADVSDFSEILETDMKLIERLDFVFSKGKLSQQYDGIEPQINTQRRIVIKEGRHPLMSKESCVPLTIHLGETYRGVVITGPNTGGKTVAMKTVAITCMIAQCGLHVSCKEAELCMNSNYLCDIGDGQNLSENLSTFSAHITSVMEILKQVNQDSLVIMDELGSGTDPTEGMGIAIAILEELKKSGALFLVTTHYPEVKNYAERETDMINARMAFDKESLKPLYQLVLGEAGESCAFYIAQRLGMPKYMLQVAAKAAYGKTEDNIAQTEEMEDMFPKQKVPRIQKKKENTHNQTKALQYQLGDSVMVFPDKKIGIVCETANDKGVLRVQMPTKKIWISHKRIKLHVPASQLYPEDYDFSIIFDSVENRKLRHQMERKYVEGVEIREN